MSNASLVIGMQREQSGAVIGSGAAGAGAVLQLAIHLVFGTPFLWSLLGALRGHLWWGSHQVIGDGVATASHVIWAMTGALGAFWLGVSMMLMSSAARGKFVGLLLVVAGATLLLRFHA